jgi:hypothetical protein
MAGLTIEVLTGTGSHILYHRAERFPVRVGRALDNDLIIPDPFVSPVHLVIEENVDGWMVTDQASDNGSFLDNGARIGQPVSLTSGNSVTIGRTTLRLWSETHPVSPTARFRAREEAPRAAVTIGAVVSTVLASGFVLAAGFLDTFTTKAPAAFLADVLPVMFVPLFWAGLWALAGFIVRRKASFGEQLIVANAAITALLLLTGLTEYVDYLSSSVVFSDLFQYTCFAALFSFLLFISIKTATGTGNARRIIIALLIGCGTVATVALSGHAARFEERMVPACSVSVKPPYAKIAPSVTLDAFIEDGEKLFKTRK